jgi:hypothetical protein
VIEILARAAYIPIIANLSDVVLAATVNFLKRRFRIKNAGLVVARGIYRQESGATNAGLQVSVWRHALCRLSYRT